jgi:hypothetical protein
MQPFAQEAHTSLSRSEGCIDGGRPSRNRLNSHFGGHLIESRPAHKLYWLKAFCGFLTVTVWAGMLCKSVNTVKECGLGFQSSSPDRSYKFSTHSQRSDLLQTHPDSYPWISGNVLQGVKKTELNAGHSFPSCDKIKISGVIPPLTNRFLLRTS